MHDWGVIFGESNLEGGDSGIERGWKRKRNRWGAAKYIKLLSQRVSGVGQGLPGADASLEHLYLGRYSDVGHMHAGMQHLAGSFWRTCSAAEVMHSACSFYAGSEWDLHRCHQTKTLTPHLRSLRNLSFEILRWTIQAQAIWGEDS